MTRWSNAELADIRRSLGSYSHEAVALLIAAVAEDPERAEQLADVLWDSVVGPRSRGFFPLACCVALSEAGFVGATDVLFDVGTSDPPPSLETAAKVALQRLGEPALRRVMSLIDEANDPFARSFGYTVLEAGDDADEALRSKITSFCATRAVREGRAPEERTWGCWPAFSASATLVALGHKPIRSNVEWWLGRQEGEVPHYHWQDLLAESHGAYATEDESHPWEEPWPTRCLSLLAELEQDAQDESHGEPTRRSAPKIGRNANCPCGSGQKYKNCCLRLDNT